jgi:hypothetical protein
VTWISLRASHGRHRKHEMNALYDGIVDPNPSARNVR